MSKSKSRGGASSAVDPDFAAALEGDSDRRDSAARRAEHKTRQLCRQVQRALSLALAERGADPGLEQLYIEDVTPAPGCGHLLVHFVAPPEIFFPIGEHRVDRAEGDQQAAAIIFTGFVEPCVDAGHVAMEQGIEAGGPRLANAEAAEFVHQCRRFIEQEPAEGPMREVHVHIDGIGQLEVGDIAHSFTPLAVRIGVRVAVSFAVMRVPS